MNSSIRLIRAAAEKRLIILSRYPINTLGQFVSVVLMFAVIFFGGQQVAGPTLTNELEGIIVGYFLWTMSFGAFSAISGGFTSESQWGTLEQMYMSPYGIGYITVTKIVVYLFETFLWGAGIMAMMLLITGEQSLHLDLITIVPIAIFTLCSAVALGFVSAGLAILYKKIDNLISLANFFLIGLIAAPVSQYPIFSLLPLSLGSAMLQEAMTNGTRLWEFDQLVLLALVVKSIVLLAAGYVVFLWFLDRAKRQGVMGDY